MANERRQVTKQMNANKDSLNQRGKTISDLGKNIDDLTDASNEYLNATRGLRQRQQSTKKQAPFISKQSNDINATSGEQKRNVIEPEYTTKRKGLVSNIFGSSNTKKEEGKQNLKAQDARQGQESKSTISDKRTPVVGQSSNLDSHQHQSKELPKPLVGLIEEDYGDQQTQEILDRISQGYQASETLGDAITPISGTNNTNRVSVVTAASSTNSPTAFITPISSIQNKSRDKLTYVGLEKKIENQKDPKIVIIKYLEKNIIRIDKKYDKSTKSDHFNNIKREIESHSSLTRNQAIAYLNQIRGIAKKHQSSCFLFRIFQPTSLSHFDRKFGEYVRETSPKLNFSK